MVVRVAVQVEQGRPGGVGQPAENGVVTTLADVDDALEDHGVSLRAEPGGSSRARCPVLLGDDGV